MATDEAWLMHLIDTELALVEQVVPEEAEDTCNCETEDNVRGHYGCGKSYNLCRTELLTRLHTFRGGEK